MSVVFWQMYRILVAAHTHIHIQTDSHTHFTVCIVLDFVCHSKDGIECKQHQNRVDPSRAVWYFANIMRACNMKTTSFTQNTSNNKQQWKVLRFVGWLISVTVLSVLPHNKLLRLLSHSAGTPNVNYTYILFFTDGNMMTSVCICALQMQSINGTHSLTHIHNYTSKNQTPIHISICIFILLVVIIILVACIHCAALSISHTDSITKTNAQQNRKQHRNILILLR